MATIGWGSAVAQFRGWGFSGFVAWLGWLLIHLIYLIEYDNRLLVLIQWANHYLPRRRGARLITAAAGPAGHHSNHVR